jgi:hypothetical protein
LIGAVETDERYGLAHRTCLVVAHGMGDPPAAEVLAVIARNPHRVAIFGPLAPKAEAKEEAPASSTPARATPEPDDNGQFGLF